MKKLLISVFIILLTASYGLCDGSVFFGGGKIKWQGSVLPGSVNIDIANGEAMFFHDTIDFSRFRGTDTGSTPYKITFTDTGGKKAVAYIGAAGSGESLTSKISNADFEVGNPPTDWNSNNGSTLSQASDPRTGSSGSYSINIARGTADYACYQVASNAAGVIIKFTGWAKKTTSNACSIGTTAYGTAATINSANWTEFPATYFTGQAASQIIRVSVQDTGTCLFDDLVFSALTEIPPTGLHLVSDKNGTTRNMQSIESGFLTNEIIYVKIQK